MFNLVLRCLQHKINMIRIIFITPASYNSMYLLFYVSRNMKTQNLMAHDMECFGFKFIADRAKNVGNAVINAVFSMLQI